MTDQMAYEGIGRLSKTEQIASNYFSLQHIFKPASGDTYHFSLDNTALTQARRTKLGAQYEIFEKYINALKDESILDLVKGMFIASNIHGELVLTCGDKPDGSLERTLSISGSYTYGDPIVQNL